MATVAAEGEKKIFLLMSSPTTTHRSKFKINSCSVEEGKGVRGKWRERVNSTRCLHRYKWAKPGLEHCKSLRGEAGGCAAGFRSQTGCTEGQ